MRIIVTGGSGFLGSHLADALSKRGHDVVLYDVLSSPFRQDGQEMIVGDVLDLKAFNEAMKGCDVVYHLAAVADLDEAIKSPLESVRVNIVGTANALELARKHKIKRFVFASTIYVYSEHGSFYRTTKRASEQLIEDYRKQYGLPHTIIRFGSLYGPRADHHNSLYRMLTQALEERRIDYRGTGKEIREYIHVLDAAEAAAEILGRTFENESISLTGRERMTTREMLEMINEIMGGGITLNFQTDNHEGHYVQTPYSYTPRLGKKMVRETYIDLGLGLLDCLHDLDQSRGPKD